MGVINFAPNLFFILILLLNYFDFSIKDFYYNYLEKLSFLQINIIYNKKKSLNENMDGKP